ncbi:MAG: PP2C family protein-serine/threonine phosphatase [Cytophagales bacterium]|nr:PP2C family protein-serine/threonine phosphatase [Cytophagales bacterium]
MSNTADVEKSTQNYLNLKRLELDTLLDLTNAINRQADEKSLFKIFLFTLAANLKINKLLVYELHDLHWHKVLSHGLAADYDIIKKIELITTTKNTPQYLSDDNAILDEKQFDIYVPVTHNGVLIGIILMGGGSLSHRESDPELIRFIVTISNILFVAIQNTRLIQSKIEQESLKKELEIARKLQSLLIPEHLPNTHCLKLFATYIPHSSVGGDYYDYIPINNDEFFICMADVSGHGIGAAIIMSNIQSALRILAKQDRQLEDIVTHLNELIYQNTQGEKFVTLFLAKYMLQKNKMLYVNCGHNAPMFINAANEIRFLNEGCMILGVFEKLPEINHGKITDLQKSTLITFTDGLLETYDKDDTDTALDIISEIIGSKNYALDTLHHHIIEKLTLSREALDDITILTCSIL